MLVGLQPPDDAVVWRIDATRALVFTTDFFTPVVDNPYDYGAIAVANSLSDIYAMGGQPALALNIAAFPADLPVELISEVLRGGAEKRRGTYRNTRKNRVQSQGKEPWDKFPQESLAGPAGTPQSSGARTPFLAGLRDRWLKTTRNKNQATSTGGGLDII